MRKTTLLTLNEIRDVMRLASDARELRHSPGLQQQRLLHGLLAMAGGERAFGVTMSGFGPTLTPRPVRAFFGPRVDPTFRSYLEQTAGGVTPADDPLVHEIWGRWGEPASSVSLAAARPGRERRRFPVFESYRRQFGMSDRLSCWFRRPEDPTGLTGFEVHRMDRASRFGPRARAVARLLAEELRVLHVRGQFEPPADPLAALPPRQRAVAERLLRGVPPKRIAYELRLSLHTVREHVGVLYRRFGVNGRDEFMAKFLPPRGR